MMTARFVNAGLIMAACVESKLLMARILLIRAELIPNKWRIPCFSFGRDNQRRADMLDFLSFGDEILIGGRAVCI